MRRWNDRWTLKAPWIEGSSNLLRGRGLRHTHIDAFSVNTMQIWFAAHDHGRISPSLLTLFELGMQNVLTPVLDTEVLQLGQNPFRAQTLPRRDGARFKRQTSNRATRL